jgi:hypothetical protein
MKDAINHNEQLIGLSLATSGHDMQNVYVDMTCHAVLFQARTDG